MPRRLTITARHDILYTNKRVLPIDGQLPHSYLEKVTVKLGNLGRLLFLVYDLKNQTGKTAYRLGQRPVPKNRGYCSKKSRECQCLP